MPNGVSSQGSRGRVRALPLAAASLLVVGSVVAGVRAVMAATGGHFIYALDDAYIHMAMAANLADFGVWGCMPDRFASASSSPLWTALLGTSYVVTGVHEWTPLVLNLAAALGALWVVDLWLQRLRAGVWTRLAALCGLALVVPLPSMVLFGMEHVLHLLLTLLLAWQAMTVLTQSGPPASRDTGRLAVLAALLAASRYEGLFLVLLVCVAAAAHGQWRRAFVVGLASLAPLAALGAASVASGSLALPNSLMLKAGGEAASALSVLLKPIAPDLEVLRASRPFVVLVAGGLVFAAAGATGARSAWTPRALGPALVAGMVLLHVHYALSSTFWVYRYDAYLVGAGLVVAAVALTGAATDALTGAIVAALAVTMGADVRANVYPTQEIASAVLTYREHYRAAQFVREAFPGETVLANDMGAMAFFAHTRVLDIFGLCDIEPVRLRREGRYGPADVESWTLPYAPTVAIVQMSWGWVSQHIPEDWEKVADIELLPEHRQLAVFAPTPAVHPAASIKPAVEAFYRPLEADGYRLHVY